mmetsp:Transcript_77163/g.121861  ORF Transcript_77163/g.121861 Transcript_77163/m.121861 type:complete len:91 (-) Transcript_77163:111-383(-)
MAETLTKNDVNLTAKLFAGRKFFGWQRTPEHLKEPSSGGPIHYKVIGTQNEIGCFIPSGGETADEAFDPLDAKRSPEWREMMRARSSASQ